MSSRLNAKVISVIPNLASFATPYTNADVLGSLNTLSSAVLDSGGCAKVISATILDAANQKADLDLLFFSDIPANSFGADNAAYALADADLPLLMGRISVAASAYQSSSTTNAEATPKNIQLVLQAKVKIKDIYMLVVLRASGGATYGAASDLIIQIGLEQF